MDKFERYNQKCKLYSFRFRKDSDQKYIDFLDNHPNRTDFLRKAIDEALK